MAKDGPMLDISKDTTITAKAYALLPNLKVRSCVKVDRMRSTCESHYFRGTAISRWKYVKFECEHCMLYHSIMRNYYTGRARAFSLASCSKVTGKLSHLIAFRIMDRA